MTWLEILAQHAPYALPVLIAAVAAVYVCQRWGK